MVPGLGLERQGMDIVIFALRPNDVGVEHSWLSEIAAPIYIFESQGFTAAWRALQGWQKPFLTTFSNRDPITRGLEQAFQEKVPGARGLRHVTVRNAGHFLQEDKGEELAAVLLDFVRDHQAAPPTTSNN